MLPSSLTTAWVILLSSMLGIASAHLPAPAGQPHVIVHHDPHAGTHPDHSGNHVKPAVHHAHPLPGNHPIDILNTKPEVKDMGHEIVNEVHGKVKIMGCKKMHVPAVRRALIEASALAANARSVAKSPKATKNKGFSHYFNPEDRHIAAGGYGVIAAYGMHLQFTIECEYPHTKEDGLFAEADGWNPATAKAAGSHGIPVIALFPDFFDEYNGPNSPQLPLSRGSTARQGFCRNAAHTGVREFATAGYILLHEMTHLWAFGAAAELQTRMTYFSETGDRTSTSIHWPADGPATDGKGEITRGTLDVVGHVNYPERSRALKTKPISIYRTVDNAETWALAALEMFVMKECKITEVQL